jgi:hypothetical protein
MRGVEKIRDKDLLQQAVFAKIADIVAEEPTVDTTSTVGVRFVSVEEAMLELLALKRAQNTCPPVSSQ